MGGPPDHRDYEYCNSSTCSLYCGRTVERTGTCTTTLVLYLHTDKNPRCGELWGQTEWVEWVFPVGAS